MIQLQVGYGKAQVLERVIHEVFQPRIRDPQRDIDVGSKLVSQSVQNLGEGRHPLARDQDGVGVRFLDAARAGRYLPADGAMQ